MHSHSYLYGLYPLGFGGGLVSQARQIPDQVTSGQGQERGVASGDFYQSLYDHPHHQFSTEAYVQPNPNSHQHSVSDNHGVTGGIDPRPSPQHPGVSSPMSSQRQVGHSRPRDEHGEREEAGEEGYGDQEFDEQDENEQDEQDEHDEQDETDD